MRRREFLKVSAAGSTLVALDGVLPRFLARTAAQAPAADQRGARDTILVVVQLTGGNDGLNTVIPFKDELYAKYRPTIKIATDQLKKINDSLGLHPSLDGLAGLLEDKSLCVVQGVGYPNPSQSHFRSMDIWQAASTAETLAEGWIGKALKQKPYPGFHLAAGNEAAPLALTGAPARVPSITSLEDFQLKVGGANAAEKDQQKKVIESVARGDPAGSNLLDFVRRTALNTYARQPGSSRRVASWKPRPAARHASRRSGSM